jgi:hypothetical protein
MSSETTAQETAGEIAATCREEAALGFSVRETFCLAAIVYGVFVWATTEFLSVFHALDRGHLLVLYLLAALGTVWFLHGKFSRFAHAARAEWAEWCSEPYRKWTYATILIVGLVALTAAFAWPNTPDVLIYHLPRVAFWQEHRGVQFYPTPVILELFQPPLGEYMMLHLHLLAGSDAWDGFVSVFGFLLSIGGASLLARELGARRLGQAIAAMTAAAIPEAILTASGAKNLTLVAGWVVVAVWAAFRFRKTGAVRWALAAGAAAGLSVATKGTAYVMLPFLFAAGLVGAKPRHYLVCCLSVVCGILILNGPMYWRNQAVFGSPLGSLTAAPGLCKYANDTFGPATTLSNVVRNVAVHLNTPWPSVNDRLTQAIRSAMTKIGIDPDDPHTTECGTHFGIWTELRNEDYAGNSLDLLFMFLTAAWAVWRFRRADRRILVLLAGLALAFLAFCSVLQWQPWNTRYHLPLFVVWAAVAGTLAEKLLARRAQLLLLVLLLAISIPPAVGNSLRWLVLPGRGQSVLSASRDDQYFAAFPDLEASMMAAADYVERTSCRNVGIDTYGVAPYYPLLAELGRHGIRAEHISVQNLTKRLPPPSGERPCAVICLDCARKREEQKVYAAAGGAVKTFGTAMVFENPAAIVANEASGFAPDMDLTGFGAIEGPFPQWNWPEVRWGLGPRSAIHLRNVNPGQRLVLVGSSAEQGQSLRILAGGEEVAQHQFALPGRFDVIIVPLNPKGGEADLELIYKSWISPTAADARPRAVLFRSIQVTGE